MMNDEWWMVEDERGWNGGDSEDTQDDRELYGFLGMIVVSGISSHLLLEGANKRKEREGPWR